jgi:hypothetical protein
MLKLSKGTLLLLAVCISTAADTWGRDHKPTGCQTYFDVFWFGPEGSPDVMSPVTEGLSPAQQQWWSKKGMKRYKGLCRGSDQRLRPVFILTKSDSFTYQGMGPVGYTTSSVPVTTGGTTSCQTVNMGGGNISIQCSTSVHTGVQSSVSVTYGPLTYRGYTVKAWVLRDGKIQHWFSMSYPPSRAPDRDVFEAAVKLIATGEIDRKKWNE